MNVSPRSSRWAALAPILTAIAIGSLAAQTPSPDTRLALLHGNGWIRVYSVGDLDNDSIPDFFTHGYFIDDVASGQRRNGNFLVSGRGGKAIASLEALPIGTEFVLPVPDQDGDGHPDLYLNTGVFAGNAVLTMLVSGVNGQVIRSIPLPPGLGGAATAWTGGHAMALLPSIDGDAVPDLLVGDGFFGFYSSGAYAFLSGLDGSVLRRVENPAGVDFTTFYHHLGKDVGVLSDIDGDGLRDVVVTQATYYTDYSDGGASVVSTNLSQPHLQLAQISRLQNNGFSGFGHHVAVPGDLDGDGYLDFVVSAPAADDPNGALRTGAVFAFAGGPGVLGNQLWAAYGTASSLFGIDLCGLGEDIDGDGRLEVVVVAPPIGRLFVLSGANGATLRTWDLIGQAGEEWRVQALDWNHDGHQDAMVSLGNGAGGAVASTRRRPTYILSMRDEDPVGLPCGPGAGPVLAMSAVHIGQPCTVDLTSALPQQFAVVAYGTLPVLGPYFVCPDCTAEAYPGCVLYVSSGGMQTLATGVTDASGAFQLQFTVPNFPALVGLRIPVQAGTTGGGPLGFTLSNGFYVRVQ